MTYEVAVAAALIGFLFTVLVGCLTLDRIVAWENRRRARAAAYRARTGGGCLHYAPVLGDGTCTACGSRIRRSWAAS